MAVDLSTITSLTVQINALQQQADKATDPSAKAFLQAQVGALQAQLAAEAQHQQNQLDASNNLLNGLGLFATLSNTIGSAAPTILSLFVKK